jgi:hypothetical protein
VVCAYNPALRRLRKDGKFEASLGYTVDPVSKTKQKPKI